MASTAAALHDNFIWLRAQRSRRRVLWRLVRKFDGRRAQTRRSSLCMPAASVNSGVMRQVGNAYALPVSIRFVLLGRCWSGARTAANLGSEGQDVDVWGETEMDNSGDVAIAQYINNGNTNVVNPVITITATGDDVVSVHLECNVCSLTYTGNVAMGHKLIIDCGARSVTNSGIGDYNGLAFDGKPPHARMVYPGPGVNTISYTMPQKYRQHAAADNGI